MVTGTGQNLLVSRSLVPLLLGLGVCATLAQSPESAGPASAPTTQPASSPASQPTTAPTAEAEAQEARLAQELAQEKAAEAQSKLEDVRQRKERVEQAAAIGLRPALREADRGKLDLEEVMAERDVRLAELLRQYGEVRERKSQRDNQLAAERQRLDNLLAAIDAMTPDERETLAAELSDLAATQRETAEMLWRQASEQTDPLVAELLEAQRALNEQRQATAESDPAYARLGDALTQMAALIANQRLIKATINDQGSAEYRISTDYDEAAAKLRAANRVFWVKYARLIMSARILGIAVAAHVGLTLVTWLMIQAIALVLRLARGEYATPAVRRVQTLIRFARSIAKLLVWVVATVSVLAQFGIHPGQSAGALGIIGLVLAGMFQQLVVDFVKGIDIALGGHYFVGDFIEAGGRAGHVLNFTVKYTVLRTPSGQVITVPNSQCVPSKRFPSGYVDNYVDIPLAARSDVGRAQALLGEVGRELNVRIEAVKREPHLTCTFEVGGQTILRVQVRVLPTCDWVIKEHFVPMFKKRFEAAGIALAREPDFFFVNDIPTFRRLFSRQMTDREIADTLKAESRPTIERAAMPDNAPDAPAEPADTCANTPAD